MRVQIQLPVDAFPERNPVMSVELPGCPLIGDFIDCHGLDNRLVVTAVAWEVAFSESFVDVGTGPFVTCDWAWTDEQPTGTAPGTIARKLSVGYATVTRIIEHAEHLPFPPEATHLVTQEALAGAGDTNEVYTPVENATASPGHAVLRPSKGTAA